MGPCGLTISRFPRGYANPEGGKDPKQSVWEWGLSFTRIKGPLYSTLDMFIFGQSIFKHLFALDSEAPAVVAELVQLQGRSMRLLRSMPSFGISSRHNRFPVACPNRT